jgi:hypothetical protein
MYKFTVMLCSLAVLAAAAAFEVATIKPAPPLDQAQLLAAVQAGGKMPVGANIDSSAQNTCTSI